MSEDPHLGLGGPARLVAYLPPRERGPLAHVLECAACRERVRQVIAAVPEAPQPEGPLTPDYAAVVDRVVAGLAEATERVEGQRAEAEAAVTALLATPEGRRRTRIDAEARFRTLAVATLLLDRAIQRSSASPRDAEDLALLAVFTLDQLDPDEAPALLAGELKVRGWAIVARACWARGDLPAAREALDRAEEIMVMDGFLFKRVGFRRAIAALRLLERRSNAVFAAAARALNLLLGPLLGEPGLGS
ncbi:MAG TPA: hypothetical protein VF121_08000 [Thermoanaerobaculia bacterium]|nr:hypothetical protein [Thermoanaerobaculia bacterium]